MRSQIPEDRFSHEVTHLTYHSEVLETLPQAGTHFGIPGMSSAIFLAMFHPP